MSDTETPETIPKKAKRQLTPEQLEKLASAREKANAVRKEKAAAKKKEKELAQIKAKQRQEQVDSELASLQKPRVTPKAAPQKKKEQVQAVVISESESESDDESSSSEESSSSSEEEIVYRRPKKKKGKPQRKQPKGVQFANGSVDDVYNHRMQQAFGSLFPQY
eukprot:SAG22_NODE_7452_length_738_cov_1.053208_1_plen_164_part_00